ncbi:hypothetical protein APUTEX25_000085, partial [Auxenochlorella protothecoides]
HGIAGRWAVRGVWTETPGPKESEVRDSFYDSTIENVRWEEASRDHGCCASWPRSSLAGDLGSSMACMHAAWASAEGGVLLAGSQASPSRLAPPSHLPLHSAPSPCAQYARQPIVQLTLRGMLDMGRDTLKGPACRIASARFVQEELPKRLARRLLDLQLLPHLVVTNPHIHRVYTAYFHTLQTLLAVPPVTSLAQNEEFTALLKRLVDDHAPMLDYLATGLREVRSRPLVGERLHLDPFLENMLRSRISRRTLAEQHMYLNQGRPGYVGVICTNMSVAEGVDFAGQRCRQVCNETYGLAPDVVITGDKRLTIPYVPSHFDYMVYEVLKNSSRAVVERHLQQSAHSALERRLPAIHARICSGEGQVTLRVSDEGGGIPQPLVDRIWEFGFTTMGKELIDGVERTEGLGFDPSFGAGWSVAQIPVTSGNRFRMGGLGFGLPLSRLYARYFGTSAEDGAGGGDLEVRSIQGYGTDTFLTLKKLEDEDWQEEYAEDYTSPMPNLYH